MPPRRCHCPKDGVDLTHLPLGDSLKSGAPKVGSLWPCHVEADAGGAFRDGPWIHGDNYDLIAKAVVSGDESWPYNFVVSRDGSQRVFSTNDLPNHATGKFPLDASGHSKLAGWAAGKFRPTACALSSVCETRQPRATLVTGSFHAAEF